MVSFYSVIINNPNETFVFYFIIPEDEKIDLKNFIHFLKPGSRIEIRYFKPNHAFAPYLMQAKYKCRHSPIIVVKVWLSEILPNVDKILFLDSDMINVAPISNIWDFDLNGKTIAGTYRVTKKWINSGFIFYNLNEIRKRKNLIKCAYQNSCFIDDYWHTNCHVNSSLIVPYRYNVEFSFMLRYERNNETRQYRLNEENNTVFFHLKDRPTHFFYTRSKLGVSRILYARKSKRAFFFLKKLFDIRAHLDYELKKENILLKTVNR